MWKYGGDDSSYLHTSSNQTMKVVCDHLLSMWIMHDPSYLLRINCFGMLWCFECGSLKHFLLVARTILVQHFDPTFKTSRFVHWNRPTTPLQSLYCVGLPSCNVDRLSRISYLCMYKMCQFLGYWSDPWKCFQNQTGPLYREKGWGSLV